jgi:hypothetical protein
VPADTDCHALAEVARRAIACGSLHAETNDQQLRPHALKHLLVQKLGRWNLGYVDEGALLEVEFGCSEHLARQGATSPLPKIRKRSRCDTGLPSVQSK